MCKILSSYRSESGVLWLRYKYRLNYIVLYINSKNNKQLHAGHRIKSQLSEDMKPNGIYNNSLICHAGFKRYENLYKLGKGAVKNLNP